MENKGASAETTTRKRTVLKSIMKWALYILSLFIAAWMVNTFLFQRAEVEGSSMEETFQDGDNLFVDKLSYRISDPERYDVIIMKYRWEPNTYYIKRIIGLPGETIQIKNGYVYIDGEKLESDTYCDEKIENAGIAEEPITLGDGEYFVMGDNRNHSHDSRYLDVGVLDRSELLGKVVIRIYPFNEIGFVNK